MAIPIVSRILILVCIIVHNALLIPMYSWYLPRGTPSGMAIYIKNPVNATIAKRNVIIRSIR